MQSNITVRIDSIKKVLNKPNNYQSLKKELKPELLGLIEIFKNIFPEKNTWNDAQNEEILTTVAEIIVTAEATGTGEPLVDSLLDMLQHYISSKSTLAPVWIAPLLYFLFPRTQLKENKNQQYILYDFLSKLYEQKVNAFFIIIATMYKKNNLYSLAVASKSGPALEVLKSCVLLQNNVVLIVITLYEISNYPNILEESNQLIEKITDCINKNGQLSYQEKEHLFNIMPSIKCVDSLKHLHASRLPSVKTKDSQTRQEMVIPPLPSKTIKQLDELIKCLENKPVQETVSRDAEIMKTLLLPVTVCRTYIRYFIDRNDGYQRIENDRPSSLFTMESETIPLLNNGTTTSPYCGRPEIQESPSP